MSSEGPKHALFAQFSAVAKALAHPDRLELLEQMAQGECTVDALARRAGLTVANASQHLQRLRRAGLAAARRDGKFVHCRIADERVMTLIAALRQVAEHNLAEVDRILRDYFASRDAMEPVSRQTLLARARDGLVTVLDVRPAEEYASAHVPGAVNIPLSELERRIAELDPAKEIVAYCRGPYCVMAFEAIAALRKRGFRARRLEDGLPEWRSAGLPVERSA